MGWRKRWRVSEDGRQIYLFIGLYDQPVAWLYSWDTPTLKLWGGNIELPGLRMRPDKQRGNIFEQKRDIEAKVLNFFDLCCTKTKKDRVIKVIPAKKDTA